MEPNGSEDSLSTFENSDYFVFCFGSRALYHLFLETSKSDDRLIMMISYHSFEKAWSAVISCPRPKARLVIFTPGGACRRLYSLRSTNFAVFCTIALSQSQRYNSGLLIYRLQHYAVRIESRISYTGRLSESFWSGLQFGGLAVCR